MGKPAFLRRRKVERLRLLAKYGGELPRDVFRQVQAVVIEGEPPAGNEPKLRVAILLIEACARHEALVNTKLELLRC